MINNFIKYLIGNGRKHPISNQAIELMNSREFVTERVTMSNQLWTAILITTLTILFYWERWLKHEIGSAMFYSKSFDSEILKLFQM